MDTQTPNLDTLTHLLSSFGFINMTVQAICVNQPTPKVIMQLNSEPTCSSVGYEA